MRPYHLLIVALACLSLAGPAAGEGVGSRAVFTTEGEFTDVKEALELAITGKGYVISHYSDIGVMLQRTAAEVGAEKRVYRHAGVVEFCSATLSRRMMESDPANILYCPFSVAVYELDAEPGTIYLAFERLSEVGPTWSGAVFADIEAMLEGIVEESMW